MQNARELPWYSSTGRCHAAVTRRRAGRNCHLSGPVTQALCSLTKLLRPGPTSAHCHAMRYRTRSSLDSRPSTGHTTPRMSDQNRNSQRHDDLCPAILRGATRMGRSVHRAGAHKSTRPSVPGPVEPREPLPLEELDCLGVARHHQLHI